MYLPYLSLEAYLPTWMPDDAGLVILERDRVVAMSRAAAGSGVQHGMRRGGVLTLASTVALRDRDKQREDESLKALAVALMQFSPQVTVAAEATVLVDVGASLRLFGGIRRLRRKFAQTVEALALTGRLGVAPTGTGAWLLARYGAAALGEASLRCKLGRIPVAVLPEARPVADWFKGLGCRTLDDVAHLPRTGLTRRTGPALLDALDRANGRQPEGFEWLTLPPTFRVKQELADRTERADLIAMCAEGLVEQLIGWLAGAHYSVSALSLLLDHERGREAIEPTRIAVAFSEATANRAHLLRLVRERINRVELPAAVLAVTLRVDEAEAATSQSESLFPEPGGTAADHARLMEVLAARLGDDKLRRLAPVPDHRPEVANRWLPLSDQTKATAAPTHLRRPLWLLNKPIALMMRQHRPYYGSPLRLMSQAERVEAGWWTDQIVARDYFVAEGSNHCCYWIFRERPAVADDDDGRWFLHGLFG